MGARTPDGPKESSRKGRKASPRETSCQVDIGRGRQKITRRGVVALGEDALHFHTGRTGRQGTDFSLMLRYDDMDKVTCDAATGLLTIKAREPDELVLHLGRMASDWLKMLSERESVLDELGVTSRSRVALVGVDDDELSAQLAARVTLLDEPAGELDFLFLGAEHRADLGRLPALAAHLRRPGGVIWVVFATRKRGVAPGEIVAAGEAAGLVAGHVIDLSHTRAAQRLTRL
jgi:hypothetical protein